jgi:hypothetical protein
VASCHNAFDAYLAKLDEVEATIDGTPSYRAFAPKMTKLGVLLTKGKGFDAPSESAGCQNGIGRFAGGAFLQFAAATGTWAECPERSKCSATERSIIDARLAVGRENLRKVRHSWTTLPAS